MAGPLLQVGQLYRMKRGSGSVLVLACGSYACIGSPESYYYTVKALGRREHYYDQNEHALAPQLELGRLNGWHEERSCE